MEASKTSDGLLGRLGEDDESLRRRRAAPVAAEGGGSTEGGAEEEEEGVLGARWRGRAVAPSEGCSVTCL